MPDLFNPESWKRELGLLPVPLYPGAEPFTSFVLLNGSTGNFCLDINREVPPSQARSEAWSTNVGHHVLVRNSTIVVRGWGAHPSQEHSFPTSYVEGKLAEFHRWLAREAPPAERNVIAHLVNVFRSTRTALPLQTTGTLALKAFLYLIACASDEASRLSVDTQKWKLDDDALDAALEIDEDVWEALYMDLREGRAAESLHTKLPLVLRHAAGAVFQEAHFTVTQWGGEQGSLPGFPPVPVKVQTIPRGIGVHFTPAPLARVIVEETLNALGTLPPKIVAFDPAAGSGEFLRELIRQLQLRKFAGSLDVIAWDITQAACDMSAFVLGWEQQTSAFPISVSVHRKDALGGDDWPPNVTMLLMNPPFLSLRDMDEKHKETVRQTLGDLATQRIDLSMAFVWKAAQSVGDGGVLGTIIPASILDGTSASALRDKLEEILSTSFIARLGSQDLFPFARVDAGVYVAKRSIGSTVQRPVLFWADHRTSSTNEGLRALRRIRAYGNESAFPVQQDGYSIFVSALEGKATENWAPRPYREWQVLRSADHHKRAGEIFSIRQGSLTGLNSAFILSTHELSLLPASEQQFFRPAVLNESISDGHLRHGAYVFYPYGDYALETEAAVTQLVPTYYEAILHASKEQLKARSGIDRKQWWLLTRPRPEGGVGKTKLVSTYFGDAGSFGWDQSGEFVVVQGYAWRPARHRTFTKTVWLGYLALVNSSVMSSLLAASSSNVGGGQWNLSKRYVERIPMPELFSPGFPVDLLRSLADIGELMQKHEYDGDLELKLAELAEAAYMTGPPTA